MDSYLNINNLPKRKHASCLKSLYLFGWLENYFLIPLILIIKQKKRQVILLHADCSQNNSIFFKLHTDKLLKKPQH